jgi:hypothetical protein
LIATSAIGALNLPSRLRDIAVDILLNLLYDTCLWFNDNEVGRVTESNSNHKIAALLIGNLADKFLTDTSYLLKNYGLGFCHCGNVYSAVVWLARRDYPAVLVFGRFEKLCAEQGRFFEIAGEKNFSCCCFSRPGWALSPMASRGNLTVITQFSEIEDVIAKFLAKVSASLLKAIAPEGPSKFIKEEFLITRQERDALLEM